MQRIFIFIEKQKYGITFTILFSISLYILFSSHIYHRGLYVSSKNNIIGNILTSKNNILSYLNLKEQNEILAKENTLLKQFIFNENTIDKEVSPSLLDTIKEDTYQLYVATVIKNSYRKSYNYLTIDKGRNDGIEQDMGVINSDGIIGIIESTSENFSIAQSILNKNSLVNATVKHSGHFGTLYWEDDNYKYVSLRDIPKLANVHVGDTVTTAGMSYVFPKGILIGSVSNVDTDNSGNYYRIKVKLFNDMSRLEHVCIVKNIHQKEVVSLEKEIMLNE